MTSPHAAASFFATLPSALGCCVHVGARADRPAAVLERRRDQAAITDFVARVTTQGGPDFVPPDQRIATFDNDGTLWIEQPMYVQLAFVLDRVKALAPQNPDWKAKQPFQAVLEGDMKALAASGEKGLVELMAATHAGMTTDEFDEDRLRLDRDRARSAVQAALHRARLPADAGTARLSARQRLQDLHRVGRRHRVHAARGPSRSTAFRPSRSSARRSRPGSRCATAGRCCSACRRSISSTTRPASRSASTSTSAAARSRRSATRTATCEMLQWTTMSGGARFGLIVHHTDAEREYAYDRQSHFGKLDKALDAAAVEQMDGGGHEERLEEVFSFQT